MALGLKALGFVLESVTKSILQVIATILKTENNDKASQGVCGN